MSINRRNFTYILQKKRELSKAVEAYKEQYGVDPTPVLETDYFSDERSGLDEGSESEKAAHLSYMRRAANITQSDVEDGAKVYERVRVGFLSQEVSDANNNGKKERLTKKKRRREMSSIA